MCSSLGQIPAGVYYALKNIQILKSELTGGTLLIHFLYMTTTKKRINISVSKEMDNVLGKLAKRDQMPTATKAEHLLQLALEIEEDQALDSIARTRDTPDAVFVSHARAWK